MHHSKRYKVLLERVQGGTPTSVAEAVRKLKSLESNLPKGVKPCRFDQTVELSLRLGIDPKQADQMVRGSVVLPHGIGKSVRVLVFAQGEKGRAAETAGADFVGGGDLAEKIKGGWLDFDVAIASPDMMSVVAPLGKILGPRKLMPSPRAGTVTEDVAAAIKEYKAGKVEFRADAGGNVHVAVGKMSFSAEQLTQNVEAFLEHARSIRPAAVKGTYIRSVTLSATMTPGIPTAA
ncbi:MAG: 50S ribosomal protein L1 [Planctomycetes bacterium]|nr:50S ribosomal protein L1 [Planctomycetota bacterium]